MISQQTIQEIIETAKVEEVIHDFVTLKRSGANMKGLCPFHNEKTPSFFVSPSKNIFKCFGCGRGGNAVHFVMEHENFSFPEALRFIAKKYGIHIEETKTEPEDEQQKLKTDSLYLLNEFAFNYFKNNLLKRAEGRNIGLSYFKERAYLDHTIQKFGLGYALNEPNTFSKEAVKEQYNTELLKELGLTTQSGYDFFRNRVIFPIHNLAGKVIAFAGRIMSKETKAPKYLNSPESEIYNKSKTLYGAYFAKSAIRKMDECILVEGYTDVITLHQSGIENVLASSGTSLTVDQIRLIKRYTNNILFLYDSDPAGIKAALRGIDMILEQDMNVKLTLLPENEDPDSYLKKLGAQSFADFIHNNAQDFILFKTRLLKDEIANDPVKKVKMLKDIVDSLAKIKDPLKRAVYVTETSQKLNITETVLVNRINKIIKSEINQRRKRERNQTEPSYSPPLSIRQDKSGKEYSKFVFDDDFQERDLIRLIVTLGRKIYNTENNITVTEYIIANIRDVTEFFDNPLYKNILTETIKLTDTGQVPDHQYYINHSSKDFRDLAITLLSPPYTYAEWDKKGYHLQSQKIPDENYIVDSLQAIMRLKERKLNKSKSEIEKRIQEAKHEDDDDNLNILLQTHQKIKNLLSQIHKRLGTVVPSKN